MDTQSRFFLDQVNAMGEPPMETLPIEEVRSGIEATAQPSSVSLAAIHNIRIPGPHGDIPLRIYIPHGQGPFPVFITFHGGGWVFGSLNIHDPLCRDIAEQAKCVVVSVDYRLAPEHKFPTPLDDCFAASVWVAKHIQDYAGDPSRLAIGGDSAGGNLAAVVTHMAKAKDYPLFRSQVLIYPVTHHHFDTSSYERYAENHFLTRSSMRWFWDLYLKDAKKDGQNPHASPLLAEDFTGLPPALIILADFDPLYDEGVAYGQKLRESHVPVTLKTYPTIHVFVTFAQHLDVGKKAIQDIASYLAKTLN